MATTLFCKRLLVSRPKLFRYFCEACADGHALPRPNPDNLQFQSLLPTNSWTKYAASEFDEMRDGNGVSSFSLAEPAHFEFFSRKAHSCTQILRFIMLGADPGKPFSLNFHLNRILLDEGKLSIVRPLLAGLLVSGFIPNLTTFNILIETYCKDLQYQHAVDVISTQMTAMGVEADESFYGDLGKDLCARLGPKSAFQLLQKLRANHIEVPIPYYHALIRYLSEREILNNVGVVVFLMEQQQDESFASFIEEFCSSFEREELPEAISTLKSRMSADRFKMRSTKLNSFLGCLGKYGLLEEAVKMFNEYREMSTFKLDNVSYGIALDCYSKLDNMDEAINLFKEMKAQMMHLDFVHYNALLEGYQRRGSLEYIRTAIAAEMEKAGINWCSS